MIASLSFKLRDVALSNPLDFFICNMSKVPDIELSEPS